VYSSCFLYKFLYSVAFDKCLYFLYVILLGLLGVLKDGVGTCSGGYLTAGSRLEVPGGTGLQQFFALFLLAVCVLDDVQGEHLLVNRLDALEDAFQVEVGRRL